MARNRFFGLTNRVLLLVAALLLVVSYLSMVVNPAKLWLMSLAGLMFVPFLLVGCGWAAMLAMPFALLTNALSGTKSMGAYLGLFNCTICLPQIIAALAGKGFMHVVDGRQAMMLVISGICLIFGAISVNIIKEKK